MIRLYPIKILDKVDQGMYTVNSFISYDKRPLLYKQRTIMTESDGEKPNIFSVQYRTEDYVAQYHYWVRINLWLVVITFDFKGDEITK